MARVNIYLPDSLAARAKAAGVNLSALTQEAVRRSLDARSTDAWLSSLRPATSQPIPHHSVVEALDAVREAAPTHHG